MAYAPGGLVAYRKRAYCHTPLRNDLRTCLKRQMQVRRCLLEYPAEIILDALQPFLAVRLETQHDHRRGVAGACQPESVGVFDTQAVQRDDLLCIGKHWGIGELCGFLQLCQQRMVLDRKSTR